MKLKRPLRGSERGADVRMVQRALHRINFYALTMNGVYDSKTLNAVRLFQRANGLKEGPFDQATLDELWHEFDAYGRWRYRLYRPPSLIPKLGPMYVGGRSVLDQDLTHATDGLPLYPAFDDAFKLGTPVIAPENILVTRDSHSVPGLAFYAQGDSKLRYWFGHLAAAPVVGTKYKKGQVIGFVGPNVIGGGPHVHVGINVELLWGAGKELEHHTNYTHGAPTIGEQLARALV